MTLQKPLTLASSSVILTTRKCYSNSAGCITSRALVSVAKSRLLNTSRNPSHQVSQKYRTWVDGRG